MKVHPNGNPKKVTIQAKLFEFILTLTLIFILMSLGEIRYAVFCVVSYYSICTRQNSQKTLLMLVNHLISNYTAKLSQP